MVSSVGQVFAPVSTPPLGASTKRHRGVLPPIQPSLRHRLHISLLQVFACAWEKDQEETPLNCYYKRNCVKLDGEYVCRAGQCSR